MQNTKSPKNPFAGLAAWGQAGGWRWHIAALSAGWLTFVAKPPLPASAPATLKHVLLAAVLLLAGFMCAGLVLTLLRPVFHAMGRLSGGELMLLFFGLINLWRYCKGRKVMRAVALTLVLPAPAPAETV